MILQKNELYQLVETYLEKGTDEDYQVLLSILEGLISKQKESPKSTYLTSLLKMQGELSEETYTITIPIQTLLHNSLQIVHGGITATLADTAMGVLVNHVIPSDKVAVTAELKMNYVSPGIGENLRCEAKLIHKGSRTCVTEGRIFSDDNKLVAYSSATFFVIPRG